MDVYIFITYAKLEMPKMDETSVRFIFKGSVKGNHQLIDQTPRITLLRTNELYTVLLRTIKQTSMSLKRGSEVSSGLENGNLYDAWTKINKLFIT